MNLDEYEEDPSEKGGSSTDTRGVIDSDEGFQDNKRLKKRALEKEVSKDGKTSKRNSLNKNFLFTNTKISISNIIIR